MAGWFRKKIDQLTGREVVQAVQEYVAPVSEVLVGLHSDMEQHRTETSALHQRTAELQERTGELQQRTAALHSEMAALDFKTAEAKSMLARAEELLRETGEVHGEAARRFRLYLWVAGASAGLALVAILLSAIALLR